MRGGGWKALAARAGTGFGWNLGGGVARAGAGLAVNATLARMLGPEPFGEMALATAVLGLGALVADGGLSVGLIQKAELEERDIRFVFTVQMGVGLGLAAGLAVMAPWGAAALGQAGVAPVLRALAAVLAIQAFGQTGTALLRREGDFRRVQQLQVGSYLIGYVGAGIPLATGGAGVWSLVAAQLAQATLYSAGAWAATRHTVRPLWRPGWPSMAGFGMTVAASNVVAWAVGALPSLLIGRFQGTLMLGYFSRAFFLVNIPTSFLTASLQTTALTMYSRAQRHGRVTARLCLEMTSVSLLAAAPVFLTAAAMPGAITELLFGERWLPMAGLLTPLALAMPLECLAALSGPLLIARGRPALEFRVQAVTAVSTLVVVGALAMGSTTGAVAWGVLGAVYLLRAALAVGAMLRETEIPLRRWARVAALPVLVGAGCFAGVWMGEAALGERGVAAWARVAVLGGAAALAAGVPVVWSGAGRRAAAHV